MKLGEFITNFSHNNLIRLHHEVKGGHQCVLESWDDVSMDHAVVKAKGKFRHYIDNEVLGLVSIHFHHYGQPQQYPEAINIVIEELDNQPFIDEAAEEEYFNVCEG